MLRSLALAMALAAPGTAQGWQAVVVQAPPANARTTVTEANGAELVIADGKVRRRSNAGLHGLEATFGEVVGAHHLEASPCGATYIAAANGVFLTHPEVRTLDRCAFGPGVPIDDVVGLVCDRIDRLWLATRSGLFVVQPGLGCHRQHTATDGLPEPPFHSLERADDGALLLHHQLGTHCYRPDPAAPTTPRAIGHELGAQCTVRLTLPHDPPSVGREHRYRERSHHLLRPAGGLIDLRKPGRHELLVYAIDRDLDLSPPHELTIDVPFPAGFDARAAAAIGAALGLALGGWCAFRARRRGRSWRRAMLDGVLAGVVLLQLAMAMTGVGRTYPFIGFTMYGEVYREHDVLFTPELVARTRTGTRVQSDGTLSFATDGVWRHLTSLLFADATTRQRFVQGLGIDVDCLELRIRRCRLTAAGPRDVAPWVLARLERGPR